MARSRHRREAEAGPAEPQLPANRMLAIKKRGKPFARGPDDRRNKKGRGGGTRPHRTPRREDLIAVLMTPIAITRNGRRTRVPKVTAALEYWLNQTVKGDHKAAGVLARLMNAIETLEASQPAADERRSVGVHDEGAMSRIVEDFRQRLSESSGAAPQSSTRRRYDG